MRGYETEELRQRRVKGLLRERASALVKNNEALVAAIDADIALFTDEAAATVTMPAAAPRRRPAKKKTVAAVPESDPDPPVPPADLEAPAEEPPSDAEIDAAGSEPQADDEAAGEG